MTASESLAGKRGYSRRSAGAPGFTLIEILVTIAVIAIMLGLAAPSFVSFQRNSELTSTANSFVAALTVARSEAMKRQANAFVVPVGASGWAGPWQVFVDAPAGGTPGAYDAGTDTLILRTDPIPTTVTVAGTVGFTDGSYVMFNGSGFMTRQSNNAIAAPCSIDFKSPATGEVRRVIANPAGRLRVCKLADAGCAANTAI